MGRNTITLGRVLGIPIALDYSWFLIFAFMTGSLASGYYRPSSATGPHPYWITGAATAIMLFVSVLLHELAHSVVARGDKMEVSSITLFRSAAYRKLPPSPPAPPRSSAWQPSAP